jgi:hypothetical protein
MAVARVSISKPSYHATILAKLHADGYDVPRATIEAIKHEFSKLIVSEHLALRALGPEYMSERFDKIPWTGNRLYLKSITPRLTVAGKVVMTAQLSRHHRVNSGLDNIRESYGSAEYIHEVSELGDDNETFSTPSLAPVENIMELPDYRPQATGPIRSTFLEDCVIESPQ